MNAEPGSRSRARPVVVLVALLFQVLPGAALAQDAASLPPPELRWLLSPRAPADAATVNTEAAPPGLPAASGASAPAPPERRPELTFAGGQRDREPLGYFSIKDPCAQENLNRNDEPLSQRTNCKGLGVPSGWTFSRDVR